VPPETDLEGLPGEDTDHVAEAVAAVDAQLAQTPEAVRNTPEFKALEKQLRSSARREGSAKAAAAAARGEAETYRLAAEATRQAALEADLNSVPEDARAFYDELAELGQSDPVAAARRLAEFMANAQSAPGTESDDGAPNTPPAGGTVPAQAPPPLAGGVDGNQPLTQPIGEDIAALTAQLDDKYAKVVARNQDPLERNRVTMRDRAGAFIAYLGSAYVKAKSDQ